MDDQLELRNPNFWKPGDPPPDAPRRKGKPKGQPKGKGKGARKFRHKHGSDQQRGDHEGAERHGGGGGRGHPGRRRRRDSDSGSADEAGGGSGRRGSGNGFRARRHEPRSRMHFHDDGSNGGGSRPSKANAGLSGRTQAMKFMARKRVAAAAKKEEEERQRRIEETHWVANAHTAGEDDDGTPKLMCVPDDKSAFFHASRARRSFGHFNPVVEEYADTATGAAHAEEEGVSADGMLERYETFVGLRPTKRQRKGPHGKGNGGRPLFGRKR